MKYSAERRANIAAGRRRGAQSRDPQRAAEFWSRVVKTDGCWFWQGQPNDSGYGTFYFRGRLETAHRVAYMLERGPIAPGMVLDHVVCDTPLCVNPWHVEQSTHRANILRSNGHAAHNARKTHCKRGHAFSEENTRVDAAGSRRCRVCERERSAWRRVHDPKLATWLTRRARALSS